MDSTDNVIVNKIFTLEPSLRMQYYIYIAERIQS